MWSWDDEAYSGRPLLDLEKGLRSLSREIVMIPVREARGELGKSEDCSREERGADGRW